MNGGGAPGASTTDDDEARADEPGGGEGAAASGATTVTASVKKPQDVDSPAAQLLNLSSMHESWRMVLGADMAKPYFGTLAAFVLAERRNKNVFPPAAQTFRVFAETPLHGVKVVVLGQDPYHGPGQAHGLAFSVNAGVQCPPSLRNIFKELHDDVGGPLRKNPDLSDWARQGVLLLNTTLTVASGQPLSHAGKGWDAFTDGVIRHVARQRTHVVFLLWGAHAHAKAELIDASKHLIIKTSHPSPLGAAKTSSPFLGSKQFSRANAYLKANGVEPIIWV